MLSGPGGTGRLKVVSFLHQIAEKLRQALGRFPVM